MTWAVSMCFTRGHLCGAFDMLKLRADSLAKQGSLSIQSFCCRYISLKRGGGRVDFVLFFYTYSISILIVQKLKIPSNHPTFHNQINKQLIIRIKRM